MNDGPCTWRCSYWAIRHGNWHDLWLHTGAHWNRRIRRWLR